MSVVVNIPQSYTNRELTTQNETLENKHIAVQQLLLGADPGTKDTG